MMMYSSMNLQAMYTGVVSKYIQNSSLKVFEEVSVSWFLFVCFFSPLKKRKKKKALFLQQTIEKEVLYLWRDSRLKVEGCRVFFFVLFFFLLLSFTVEVPTTRDGEERGRRRAGDSVFSPAIGGRARKFPLYRNQALTSDLATPPGPTAA